MRDKLVNIFEFLKERLEHPIRVRIIFVAVLFAVLFGIILNRLYVLQVVNGGEYYAEFIGKNGKN